MPSAVPTRACPCGGRGRAGDRRPGFCGHRGIWGRAVAGRTGACAQDGDLPAGANQTSVHTEGQRELRPLGISTVRDRVCMTAAMLVLEPIFEADLPPEIYAYRAGRNAQQAVVEVEELVPATRLNSARWPSSHCEITFSSQPISCRAKTSNIVAWTVRS